MGCYDPPPWLQRNSLGSKTPGLIRPRSKFLFVALNTPWSLNRTVKSWRSWLLRPLSTFLPTHSSFLFTCLFADALTASFCICFFLLLFDIFAFTVYFSLPHNENTQTPPVDHWFHWHKWWLLPLSQKVLLYVKVFSLFFYDNL